MIIMAKFIFQVKEFVNKMGASKSFYGYDSISTIPSLLIKCLPTQSVKFAPLKKSPTSDRHSPFSFILKLICSGLKEIYGFKITDVS